MHLPLSIALTLQIIDSGHNGVVHVSFLLLSSDRCMLVVHLCACACACSCGVCWGGGVERLTFGELWRHYSKGLVLLFEEAIL